MRADRRFPSCSAFEDREGQASSAFCTGSELVRLKEPRSAPDCLWRRDLALTALVVALGGLPGGLNAQSDNFNDGNDTGWTRSDPISGAVGSARGTWSFPNGGYRIQTAPSPSPTQLGPARVASIRNDVTYTNFYVAVDVVAWDDTLHQAFGLLSRLSNLGLGTTRGYAFTYQAISHDVQISRVDNEAATAISPVVAVTLDPTRKYRVVFIGSGASFEGRIYGLPDIKTPIVSVTGSDATYASGVNGLLVYDNSSAKNAPADATFDNYLATDKEPPTLSFQLDNFGEFLVSWPSAATGFQLQSSPTLAPATWTTIPDVPQLGNTYQYTDFPVTGIKFFRLVK
jgi:hypothetical protein